MPPVSEPPPDTAADGDATELAPVLIIGDNPVKLMALVAALAGVAVDLVTATSGAAALPHLRTRDFAVVLLDINMPILDGFATARLIRSQQRSAQLPILFITAERLTDDAQSQGYGLGVVDYLGSPVRPEFLRTKVAIFADLYCQRLRCQQQACELSRKNAEIAGHNAALQENEQLLGDVLRLARMARFTWEIPSGHWTCEAELGVLLGIDPRVAHTSADWAARLHPDDRARVMVSLRPDTLGAGQGIDQEFRICNPEQGTEHWVHLRGKWAYDGQPQPQRLFGSLQDIGAHKRAEDLMRQEAIQSRLLFDHNADGLLVIDLEGRIRLANPAAGVLFGLPPAALVGQPFGMPVTGSNLAELTLVAGGVVKTVSMTSANFTWISQPSILVSLRDITDKKQLEDQVHHLAYHDGLTQLPNLHLFYDRLDQAMVRSARYGTYCALIFLDLDNFKPLNDSHGHAVGDLLLIALARRLQLSLRQTDTVARVGGDEFVLILCDLPAEAEAAAEDAQRIAEKLRGLLAEPYRLEPGKGGQPASRLEHSCPASLGVTLFKGVEKPEDIVNRADAAMYRVKQTGGNGVHCQYPAPATPGVVPHLP